MLTELLGHGARDEASIAPAQQVAQQAVDENIKSLKNNKREKGNKTKKAKEWTELLGHGELDEASIDTAEQVAKQATEEGNEFPELLGCSDAISAGLDAISLCFLQPEMQEAPS